MLTLVAAVLAYDRELDIVLIGGRRGSLLLRSRYVRSETSEEKDILQGLRNCRVGYVQDEKKTKVE